jgi:hypothetical protein
MDKTDAISSLAFAKSRLSVSNFVFHISPAIGPIAATFASYKIQWCRK